MKYHEIQVNLEGGRVFFSAVADPSAQATSLSSTATTTKSDDGLISETLMNKLSTEAMPNDFRKFVSMLQTFEHLISIGLPVDKRALYNIQTYANQIIKLSDYMKKAEEQAINNGSWDEVAIDNNGNIYTIDEKRLVKAVHISKFDKTKQRALSIGELIQLRKEDDSLIDNQDVVTTVGNAIGTEKINDYIQGIIKMVGSAETTVEAYKDLASMLGDAAKKPTASELATLQGLSLQLETLGASAIFKLTESSSSKNIKEAADYILSMLPRNMRMLLQGRYVAEFGGKYEDAGKHAQEIVGMALMADNDSKYTSKIDYEGDLNSAAGNTRTGLQNRNLNNLEVLIQGSLNQVDYQLRSPKTPSLSLTLRGTDVGALTTVDNNIIPKAPISTAIEQSIGPLIDKNHMTMGTQKISEGLLDTIMYDGNDVINVWAPVNSNGDIDFEGMQKLHEVLEALNRDASLTNTDKNAILKEHGIDGHIDDKGSFVGGGSMAQFLVFTGVTSDEVLSEDDPYVEVLDKQSKALELQMIELAYSRVNSKIKNKDAQLKFQKGWFDMTTDIIKAPVFLKLKSTAQTQVATLSNRGPMVTTPTYADLLVYDLMRQIRQQGASVMQPSSSLIFLKNE